uniref:Reverse transcriptase domain-containing protein n=1 Tax=Cynoglossus semilaevis TaxID=244447 RepID=A0A3P8VZQ2_CYNSE
MSQNAPWFNTQTRALKLETRRLERAWRSTHNDSHYVLWRNSFDNYKRALKHAKTTYYSELIDKNKSNPRFLFSTVARLTESQNVINPKIPLSLRSNDFLTFFNDKIDKIRDKINHLLPPHMTKMQFSMNNLDTMVTPILQLNEFNPLNLPELRSLVSAAKSTTCQLDPIPARLVKESLPQIGHIILQQINMSLLSGCVPEAFKIAVIKPLLKKPSLDAGTLANYRPISNLPFISKILEKAVASQLCDHLHDNNLFEKFQSGFRTHHSTETALLRVQNDVLVASDKGLASILVLLDLSAAFDTIDREILLHRLEKDVGIKGSALAWFKSYLSNRFQFVNVNEESSILTKVNYGVPQGSVLGPILFTLYMLPLGNIIRKHNINFHCYADDTQLYVSVRPDDPNPLIKIQDCLRDILTWMTQNFLMLNTEKTEVIVLGPKHIRAPLSNLTITIGSSTPVPCGKARNLGVLFDQDLSLQKHINQTCRTAFYHLRNIKSIRKMLSRPDSEKLIHAFITSRLDYCNSLLSGCPNKSLRSLQLVQNAAARILTGTRRREHITPVLASIHWLPVKSRIDFKILLITYKALNNQAPLYICDLITPYKPNRSLRSQNSNLLVIPKINKNRTGGRTFSYQAPLLWNQLPLSVRESDSVSSFKVRLKTHLYSIAYSLN